MGNGSNSVGALAQVLAEHLRRPGIDADGRFHCTCNWTAEPGESAAFYHHVAEVALAAIGRPL